MKTLKAIDPLVARYIAGFFDGEGTVAIYKARPLPRTINPTMYLSLNITNTDLEVLEFIAEQCGGCIVTHRRKNPLKRPWSPVVYHWHAYSREGAHVLRSLFPFLRVKREQAAIGLRFAELTAAQSRLPRPKRRGMARLTTDEIAMRASLAQRLRDLKRPWKSAA